MTLMDYTSQILLNSKGPKYTLPETNIAPENGGFQ